MPLSYWMQLRNEKTKKTPGCWRESPNNNDNDKNNNNNNNNNNYNNNNNNNNNSNKLINVNR